MSLWKSFCLKPPACLLLAGPQENSFNSVLESTDWYCPCLSPQTTKAYSHSAKPSAFNHELKEERT